MAPHLLLLVLVALFLLAVALAPFAEKHSVKKVKPPVDIAAAFNAAMDVYDRDPSSLDEMLLPREGNPVTLSPRIPSAADMALKQKTRAAAAGEAYSKAVQNPRKDPIVRMKASNATFKNAVQLALNEDRWIKGVNNIDEAQMYQILATLGSTAYVNGVNAKSVKYESKMAKVQPMVAALVQQLDAMDTSTDGAREAKMIAARRGMIAIGQRLRGK